MKLKALLSACVLTLALAVCPVESALADEAVVDGSDCVDVVTTQESGEKNEAVVDVPADVVASTDSVSDVVVDNAAVVEDVTTPSDDVTTPEDASTPASDSTTTETPDSTTPDPSVPDDEIVTGVGSSESLTEEDSSSPAEAQPAEDPQPAEDSQITEDLQPTADSQSAADPQPSEPAATPAAQDTLGGAAPAQAKAATVEMHRLYNPWTGEHFYTASTVERDSLTKLGWRYEGVGWTAPATSNTPVYRLYNPYVKGGDHHYTMSAEERDHLKSVGWKFEGIGWYSDDQKGVGLFRQYNPYASTGTHNYTVSAEENLNLVSHGWRYEGVAWYAVDLGPVAPSENFSGWKESGGKKFYGYGDGSYATGWQTIDGTRYHFDGKGRLSTGLSYIDNTYYSLSASGTPDGGWKNIGSFRYYFDPSSGAMRKDGWFTYDGKTYYLDKTSGVMATGDKWIDGVLRPFASNGVCLKTGYQVSWKGLHLAAENVKLPSYTNGSKWNYAHSCTISANATREQCIEAFIAVAYEYMNAGTRWVDNNCGRPGTTVDCSGLVMEGLYAAGMDLTGVAGGDFNPYSKYYWNHSFANTWRENQTFQPVSRSELERGDLVYWDGHVAIYLGNGQIIESTSVASNVRVRSLYAENLILGYARPFTK